MPSWRDAIERMLHHAPTIHHEGRAYHAHPADAVDLAQLPSAVLRAHLAFRVGKQAYRQTVPVTELGMGDAVVPADTDDRAVEPRELGLEVAELGRLRDAARRAVLDVEVEDERPTAKQIAQVEHVHVRVRQRKIRRRLPGMDQVRLSGIYRFQLRSRHVPLTRKFGSRIHRRSCVHCVERCRNCNLREHSSLNRLAQSPPQVIFVR